MEQLSFSDLETSLRRKTRKTRTERLTERLEKLVPWSDLLALIQPFYYESGRRGRQPFPLELMLRIHLLQIAYNMSDPQMEDFLHENSTARKFVGLALADRTPDESTIPSSVICSRSTTSASRSLNESTPASPLPDWCSPKDALLMPASLRLRAQQRIAITSGIRRCRAATREIRGISA